MNSGGDPSIWLGITCKRIPRPLRHPSTNSGINLSELDPELVEGLRERGEPAPDLIPRVRVAPNLL